MPVFQGGLAAGSALSGALAARFTSLIRPWAEHLRQHERSTKADRAVEERLRTSVTGIRKVRHLVAAESDG
jgi:hypothetical protein